MSFSVAALVLSGVQAVNAIQQGKLQKEMYQMKATQARLDAKRAELAGRQDALNYSRQAVDVLNNQRRLAGTIAARAGAGGVNPFTGSALTVNQYNAFRAGEEFNVFGENADMAIAGGLAKSQAFVAQAASYDAAGKQAMKSAYMGAIANIAGGVVSYGQLSTPGGGLGGSALDPNSVGAAQGYGLGGVGYGAGYGISPFGQQAQMLSAQW